MNLERTTSGWPCCIRRTLKPAFSGRRALRWASRSADGAMTAADVARIAVAQLAKGKKKIVPRTFNDTVQDRLCRCLPRAVYCGLIEGMVQKRIAR